MTLSIAAVHLWNLLAYSLQLAVLVGAAAGTAALLGLHAPRPALRYWRLVLAAAVCLPFLQPWSGGGEPLLAHPDPVLSGIAAVAPPAPRGLDWTTILVTLVAAGALLKFAWLAAGLWRLRRMVSRATPAAPLASIASELAEVVGCAATPLVCDELDTPATVGVRRPVILVPRRLLDMPARVQRAALVHELVHVRRRDWLQTLADECWSALLWFHPAARVLARRLSLARETVVDEQALLLTGDRRAYAEALLAFADPPPQIAGVTPLIGRHDLRRRIALIAREGPMSRRRTLATFLAALVLSGSATAVAAARFPMAAAQAADREIHQPGHGITLPAVLTEVKPVYTPEAMKQRIQGSVFMSVVVLPDGTVGDVRVTESLDAEYGLDREAVKAMRQWTFTPGTKDGTPVPVQVTVEMTFTLKK